MDLLDFVNCIFKCFLFISKMEYFLQVITHEEGEKRGKEYDNNTMTYLFDLDFNLEDEGYCPYTIDAANYGNASHFINHSVSMLHIHIRVISNVFEVYFVI